MSAQPIAPADTAELCPRHDVPVVYQSVKRGDTYRVLPCCLLCEVETGEVPCVIGTSAVWMRRERGGRERVA